MKNTDAGASTLQPTGQPADSIPMDVIRRPPRSTAGGVRVTHATPRVVITRDASWHDHVYVLTAIGWRLRTHPLRDDGYLVTDPALHALLDAAAADSE